MPFEARSIFSFEVRDEDKGVESRVSTTTYTNISLELKYKLKKLRENINMYARNF